MPEMLMNGAPDPPPGFTDQQLQQMFNNLLAASQEAQEAWMQRYVPPFLWDHFEHYFEEHVAGDPNTVLIANNDPILVVGNDGTNLPGTPGRAEVSGGVLQRVRMQAQPLATIVFSGQQVAMQVNTGAAMPGSPGIANVTNGVLNYVRAGPATGNSTVVFHGAVVRMETNTGGLLPGGANGAATVSTGQLQHVRADAAPTSAIVTNNQSVTVMDNGMNPAPGSPGTATVSAGTLQLVRLGAVDVEEPPVV